jgi:hypothetical protein
MNITHPPQPVPLTEIMPAKSFHQRRLFLPALVALAAFAVLGTGCASSGGPDATPVTPATAVVTKVVTQEANPPSSARVRASTGSKAAERKTKKRKDSNADSFVMPNEVGRGLQAAQDDIQRVSSDPVFVSHSHDDIKSRFQIFDRDWKVCDQNVRSGKRISAIAHIDFGVVKLDESCP